jgi:hypothetical protein
MIMISCSDKTGDGWEVCCYVLTAWKTTNDKTVMIEIP